MKRFVDLIAKGKEKYGKHFDDRDLVRKFIPFYESGQRIEVDFGYGTIKRGTVGVTTGWIPEFILLLRRDSFGSSYTLSNKDKIVKVIK
jgi:hypothetical protein